MSADRSGCLDQPSPRRRGNLPIAQQRVGLHHPAGVWRPFVEAIDQTARDPVDLRRWRIGVSPQCLFDFPGRVRGQVDDLPLSSPAGEVVDDLAEVGLHRPMLA